MNTDSIKMCANGTERPVPMRTETRMVTPRDAEAWLDRNVDDNRTVSWHTVESLAADMTAGAWKLTHQGIAFDLHGRLVDGQHRLHAVVKSGCSVLMQISWYDVQLDDPIDRNRVRSVSFLTKLSPRVVGAMTVLRSMESGYDVVRRMTVNEARELYAHHGRWAESLHARVGSLYALRSGVVAAMIWTYPIDEEKVASFTRMVCTGEMLAAKDPAFRLRSWLASASKHRGSGWAEAMGTCAMLAYHLRGMQVANVQAGETNYQAITSKRRALKIAHTPDPALVPTGRMP